MKKIKQIRNKVTTHPIMTFGLLILFTIVLSGILNLFNVSTTYNTLDSSGHYNSVLVSVESLLNLSGVKYIFSNTLSSFASFTPLSMLLIILIGIGIMDKSGFLDSLFYLFTKRISKKSVTFSLSLICIFATIMGDISFVILIPLAALLFKYGKRNPRAGIVCAFASLSCGVGVNIFMNSVDSALLNYTTLSAQMVSSDYVINTTASILIMSVVAVLLALIITNITERITVPDVGAYEFEDEEEDYLTKTEKRALAVSLICGFIYIIIFVYNIIPNAPFGGNLLDYSQTLYIDKLFGYNSFFNQGFVFVVTLLFIILGLSYGIVNKTIKNHRDVCAQLSHSLDGVGKVLVLIFAASMFIFIFKKTNMGTVLVASLSNALGKSNFTGIPLILFTLIISALATLFAPGSAAKWSILSITAVPVFMNSGMSPEFSTVILRAGECITYGLTPLMAYFVIYIAFMELYCQNESHTIKDYIKYILPYSKYTALLWIVILIVFYVIRLPLGISTFPVL